jgi:hypothetical protein
VVDSGQPGGSLRSAALAGGALLCSLCIEAAAAAAVYCHRCFTVRQQRRMRGEASSSSRSSDDNGGTSPRVNLSETLWRACDLGCSNGVIVPSHTVHNTKYR